jgi:tetratricopeptide (TPR) repeat protein
VEVGDYPAAREKFGRAMTIRQAIGDRAGEAATWNQLGNLARQMGNATLAAQMIALCWLIDKSIGHGDAEQDLKTLLGFCQQIGFTNDQVQQAIDEAAAAYKRDRGQTLLLTTFPELASVLAQPK